MTPQTRSILVVAAEPAIGEAVTAALRNKGNLRVDTQTASLSELNGSAVRLAGDYDMVLVRTHADDAADLAALRTLAAGRRSGSVLVALADGDITLAQAQALTRAGVTEVLPFPETTAEFGDQIARLGLDRPAAGPDGTKAGRIIAVAQSRGGVGSTTVAVNLADQLVGKRGGFLRREEGHSVALVDFDLQFGTVGSFLDLDDQDTLLQLAMDGTVPDATFLRQSMVTMENGLSVLAAPSKFAPIDSLRPEQVAAILDTLRQTHDYVVVDLPRALVGWIEPIVQRADEMILVTDISVSSVRHCRRLIDFFTADNVALPIQIVVNHERKPLLQSRLVREAEKVLQRKVDHWLPHDPRAAGSAADRGKPLSAVAPHAALTKAVARLATATAKTFPASHKPSVR